MAQGHQSEGRYEVTTNTAAIHARLAKAYGDLADIHAELAGNHPGQADQPAPTQLRPLEAARPQVHALAPAAAPGPSPVLSVNMATHCPKHGTEYRRGNYGLYCPNVTDDPAFADRKGYCNLPGQDAQRAVAWVDIQRRASDVR